MLYLNLFIAKNAIENSMTFFAIKLEFEHILEA